ncbi:MAG: hypothetical protein HYZ58_18570 [Acidobacteria bacterium]|nr:hypothetical protein [Acidobacteriota bacterium]
MTRRFALLAVVPLLVVMLGAAQEHHPGAPPERLGNAHFPTSCTGGAQADFDRGIALLHSFWFPEAVASFKAAIAKDAGCGIAHWGIALSNWGNPFAGLRSPASIAGGAAAIAEAQKAGARTDRERAYIAAAAELYKDSQTIDQRTRTLAYERAMEQVYKTYPNDPEAAAFYALALDQDALPTDKTYANQLKAAAILEKLFAAQPDHPGVAHYIIHTYDTPALAPKALTAARRYASIAPSVPYALHMPSHTFTRVGLWQDSIETNIKSAEAAKKSGPGGTGEELHASDYETYAFLQTGQDAAAKKVVDSVPTIVARFDTTKMQGAAPAAAGSYAVAAIAARYALERGMWKEASALEVRPSSIPYVEAITHFARALGSARSGNPADAGASIERLAALRDAMKQASDPYWTEQIEIQRLAATAWKTFAEGRKDDAVDLLKTAAEREDATDKSAISPGPLAPAREQLGEMLLDMGRSAEALKAFEATTVKEPNRFRGVYGAARAAELSGNRQLATKYYRQLIEICKRADTPGRSELQNARRFLRASH